MKKLTVILLTLLLVLCLAACGTDKPEVPDDTTPSETEPLPVEKETVTIVRRNERPAFRLVYGKDCDESVSSLALSLRDTIDLEMGVVVNKRDDSKAEETFEILVGDTNREESAASLIDLADTEFIVSFDGEKLVFNAKETYGVQCAVRRFMERYIIGREECVLPTDFVWKEPFFHVACAEDCPDVVYASAVLMRSEFDKLYENRNPDAEPIQAYEILLGDCGREESEAALAKIKENEYIISFDGEKLILNAHDPYGVRYAARRYLNDFVRGKDNCAMEAGTEIRAAYEIPEQIFIINGLKRGMNLETVRYETALTRDAALFQMLAESGFDHIRLPINFDLFLNENGVLDEEKMQAVDQVIWNSIHAGLPIFLDLHYSQIDSLEACSTPDRLILPEYEALFYSIWTQLANRYKDYPLQLLFEFLNEPLMSDYDRIQLEAYRIVREIDPERILILSSWANATNLITVPEDDDFLVLTIHDYDPGEFTHQLVGDVAPDRVPYSREVFEQFQNLLHQNALIGRRNTGLRVVVGEFSISPHVTDSDDVSAFLSDATIYMEQLDLAWTYWEFDNYWAAYDHSTESWKEPRYGGLMGKYSRYMKEGD